jgi:hypothetical protein
MDRDEAWAQVNTELLYAAPEHAKARDAYTADHPDGPAWDDADRATRGRYLEAAGQSWLGRLED